MTLIDDLCDGCGSRFDPMGDPHLSKHPEIGPYAVFCARCEHDTTTPTANQGGSAMTPNFIHSEIHHAIDGEFASAFKKHGGRTPRSHSVGDRESLVVLVEEVGEVARAMTYDEGNDDRLYAELIQVAAMSAAWAERLNVRGDR